MYISLLFTSYGPDKFENKCRTHFLHFTLSYFHAGYVKVVEKFYEITVILNTN